MGARSGGGTGFDMQAARRRWLARIGALASSTVLPQWLPRAWSQSQPTLNNLPRVALVMGNTNYSEAPLRNPVNDAKAIGSELQKLGFNVNLHLNAGRAQTVSAIQAFAGDLVKSKGVGLFYYAGHGAQLAWRNYLIPVDAAIERLEDMRSNAVELNTLLQGLIAARNPMNVIILDACRDNPFGNKVLTEQRGLSQFDAPPGSLLAYATSPGNTAADGEGENGLYTENLLRELTVPEVKIEDVFKRVRLAVRRKSEGRQIPWESTSLEEDFYFQPPKQVKKLSKEELDRQFEEELEIWEKIKNSKDPAPLEDYLGRFPSGKFSEVAQFRLERVLAQIEQRVQLASISAVQAEAERKRREELARAEAELKKQQELSIAEAARKQKEEAVHAEAERQRQQALAKAEAERLRLEELARAETERRKKEDLAKTEAERKRQEELARAEAEVRKQQTLAKAEADRKQQEALARAESELKKQQELAKAEAARKQQEEIVRAETERKRQEAVVQAEAERKRLEELALAEAERRKKEDLAKVETERKQREELARAEAELRKQQDLAKAEAAKFTSTAVIVVASIAPNPFSKGTAIVDTNYKVGDSYTYRVTDLYTKITTEFTRTITQITDDKVIYDNGYITDLLGNNLITEYGKPITAKQIFGLSYAVGRHWTSRSKGASRNGVPTDVERIVRVIARENVVVPAGTFNAFVLETDGWAIGSDINTSQKSKYWIAPEQVRVMIARETITRSGRLQVLKFDREELVSFRQT